MSKPIRISEEGHKILVELSKENKKSMSAILEELLLAEKKKSFFKSINVGYNQLKNNTEDWKEEMGNRKFLNKAVLETIPEDEVWEMQGEGNDEAK